MIKSILKININLLKELMGSCVNKRNNIITMRINPSENSLNFYNKKHFSTPIPSKNIPSPKKEKLDENHSLPLLKICNVSKILNFSEKEDNNSNTFREILQIFN